MTNVFVNCLGSKLSHLYNIFKVGKERKRVGFYSTFCLAMLPTYTQSYFLTTAVNILTEICQKNPNFRCAWKNGKILEKSSGSLPIFGRVPLARVFLSASPTMYTYFWSRILEFLWEFGSSNISAQKMHKTGFSFFVCAVAFVGSMGNFKKE